MSGRDPIPQPQAYEGVRATNPPNFIKAKRAPGNTSDSKYPVGTQWSNTLTNIIYQKSSAPNTWTLLGSGSTGGVLSLTTDDANVVTPTSPGGTISIIASTGLAATVGSVAGSSVTLAITNPVVVATGGTGRQTLTNHGVLIGAGTSAITQLAAASTGTVLSGSTGADPAFVALADLNVSDVTTATQAISVSTTYIADHASALVVFTLPATAAQGSFVRIFGNGPGGWQINQNANQVIKAPGQTTTTGTGGSLSSSNRYNAVTLFATVGGASTTWTVVNSSGSLTFV